MARKRKVGSDAATSAAKRVTRADVRAAGNSQALQQAQDDPERLLRGRRKQRPARTTTYSGISGQQQQQGAQNPGVPPTQQQQGNQNPPAQPTQQQQGSQSSGVPPTQQQQQQQQQQQAGQNPGVPPIQQQPSASQLPPSPPTQHRSLTTQNSPASMNQQQPSARQIPGALSPDTQRAVMRQIRAETRKALAEVPGPRMQMHRPEGSETSESASRAPEDKQSDKKLVDTSILWYDDDVRNLLGELVHEVFESYILRLMEMKKRQGRDAIPRAALGSPDRKLGTTQQQTIMVPLYLQRKILEVPRDLSHSLCVSPPSSPDVYARLLAVVIALNRDAKEPATNDEKRSMHYNVALAISRNIMSGRSVEAQAVTPAVLLLARLLGERRARARQDGRAIVALILETEQYPTVLEELRRITREVASLPPRDMPAPLIQLSPFTLPLDFIAPDLRSEDPTLRTPYINRISTDGSLPQSTNPIANSPAAGITNQWWRTHPNFASTGEIPAANDVAGTPTRSSVSVSPRTNLNLDRIHQLLAQARETVAQIGAAQQGTNSNA
ncbi:hypothetical protein AMS68_002152 [Peltaster fructicola]|uniref:Uncharacterized protein n=1 Tax=Peltaster fructicola TaxID=286661 RepID=A0A6H0XPS5_9PEZI|nr:hypothetical protein AMS68_002152 [Peltaster fructicola]